MSAIARNAILCHQVNRVRLPDFEENRFVRRHITFHGRVQKVGFRIELAQMAERLELTGWVKNADGYIDFIIERVLPVVTEQGLADFCDVFLESSVFNVPQSRKLLLAAQKLGLQSKVHADEIDPLGGSELAGEIGAISAEHLIATRDSGIEAMAKAKTTACLLPQTSLYLNKPFARARDMISAGVPVAIATDFNPGSCPSLNLQLSMNLGYLRYRLFPEEVLTAVTLNAACAIGKGDSVGSIEPGKLADIVLWNADELPMLCYRMGSNQVKKVISRKKIC